MGGRLCGGEVLAGTKHCDIVSGTEDLEAKGLEMRRWSIAMMLVQRLYDVMLSMVRHYYRPICRASPTPCR